MADTENNNSDVNKKDRLMSGSLNSDTIKELFAESSDIVSRTVLIRNREDLSVTLFYVDGMAQQKIINDNIVYPLSRSAWYADCDSQKQAYTLSLNGGIEASSVKPVETVKEAIDLMLVGMTILVFDRLERALIINTIGFDKRGISAATEENTYRSGKDSFVETLRLNTATLRKKIKSPNLVIIEESAGKQTNSRYCIAYMHNICNDKFVSEIKKRMEGIERDKVMTIRDVYTSIVNEKYTPFPAVIVTEKPDACCMSLLDGKIAVIVDELPYALLLPAVFGDFFQGTADYGENFIVASFFRIIRYLAFFLGLLLPGFFVAVTMFHPGMIPYTLAVKIAASRTGVPFSMILEVLIMSFAFFVLIQASMHISRAIGATISIVGGLVLGQAAITAGIVSPAVIVVVAAASICSLAIPNKEVNAAMWLFQLLCTLLSAMLGLLGLILTLLVIFFMLAKLKVLGVPYLAPYATLDTLQLADSIVRYPENLIKMRPSYLDPKNKRRAR